MPARSVCSECVSLGCSGTEGKFPWEISHLRSLVAPESPGAWLWEQPFSGNCSRLLRHWATGCFPRGCSVRLCHPAPPARVELMAQSCSSGSVPLLHPSTCPFPALFQYQVRSSFNSLVSSASVMVPDLSCGAGHTPGTHRGTCVVFLPVVTFEPGSQWGFCVL